MLIAMAEPADPDLDLARRFLGAHPPPGRVLLCAVVGPHQRGVVPPRSGLDLAGLHIVPTRALLGLDPRPEAHAAQAAIDQVDCTLNSDEIAPALASLLVGDGIRLERILSPWQVVTTRLLEPLQQLARDTISRRFGAHYVARYEASRAAHVARPTPSSMVGAYQVALTGTHLLRSGRLEANVGVLVSYYGYPGATELIDMARAGHGDQPLTGSLATHHAARLPILAAALAQAQAESTLPTQAPNRRDLEAWLVEVRVAELK
jgi:hypothetical protein